MRRRRRRNSRRHRPSAACRASPPPHGASHGRRRRGPPPTPQYLAAEPPSRWALRRSASGCGAAGGPARPCSARLRAAVAPRGSPPAAAAASGSAPAAPLRPHPRPGPRWRRGAHGVSPPTLDGLHKAGRERPRPSQWRSAPGAGREKREAAARPCPRLRLSPCPAPGARRGAGPGGAGGGASPQAAPPPPQVRRGGGAGSPPGCGELMRGKINEGHAGPARRAASCSVGVVCEARTRNEGNLWFF